ncbi:PKD domain-containing protein [Chryseosolibacter indicus]|uniref:Gliding motility-associated C-terminal domain-containing protein n=1 Tax=Chryseosolibacter indicus TaxID=2782351 RepID=A0ABS5VR59_9BACT|nr:PKD domain-containing protein [Chryseosolibacter indicus]MBT1702496.1 gliding motility-associated C-terminal domain-containing protein [Chryseosolibacter indicus]
MQRNLLSRLFFILAIVSISTPELLAQDQTDQNWFFGNGAQGIQFTRPGDTARLVTRPTAAIGSFGANGSAVASDPVSGALLFYTDGVNVYDATHRLMPNGSAIGGNANGNQPVVITKAPGQPGKYYIFTNTATATTAGDIHLTIVDSASNGNTAFPNTLPLGDVESKNQPITPTPLVSQSQAMIAIPHETDKNAFWLITQDANTSSFRITTINASSITVNAAVPMPTGFNFSAANFTYHPATGKLAVVPSEPGRNVMIMDFDPATGNLTFDPATGFVFNSATTGTAVPPIYDVEFSNTGDYLYVSRQGDGVTPGGILQFDLTNPSATPIAVNTGTTARSYGLQIAPDSSIYHIYQTTVGGPFLVGRITDPDTVATAANYEPTPFGTVNFNSKQFPSFLKTSPPDVDLDFTYSGTCATQPTTFFPEVVPGADSLVWRFGDGTGTSSNWSPTYTYQQGGTFEVTLSAYVNGVRVDSVKKPITITQFDLQLTLVQDTTACSCELRYPKERTPPPPTAYPNGQPCNPFTLTAQASGQASDIRWFGPAGEITALRGSLTLTNIDSAGFYYIKASDQTGQCFAYAGVNIKEYGVEDPRTNIWHFGNSAGINFNPDFRPSTGADAIQGFITDGPEGVATISDRNGQVIISTDGEQVYDRAGNPLLPPTPPGPGLGGSKQSTQSSLIIPVASDPTLYYIFTTQNTDNSVSTTNYELRYAIFDLKAGTTNPNGAIIDPDNDPSNGVSSVLFTRSTERITGNENWLIAHEFGTNNFRAYRITGDGLSAPVISSAGSVHSISSEEEGQGYMKLTASGQLAVALKKDGRNYVEIFDFDNATGAITLKERVDLNTTTGQVYGVEISQDGQKLYATTRGPGSLHEFYYDSTSSSYVKINPVITHSADLGAIERGPDGQTYVAINGSNSLGTISPGATPQSPSTFNPSGFPLSPTVPPGPVNPTSTLGLPNFIQNIGEPTQAPTIDATGLCHGLPTRFTGSGSDPIDTLIWDFGDGEGMRGANLTEVEHTYDTAGTYYVTLTIRNRCIGPVDILRDTVIINRNPEALSGAAPLCNASDAPLQAVAAGTDLSDLTFLWSPTGDTTASIIPTIEATYEVIVRTTAGCADTGRYFVGDLRPHVNLGPDLTLCEGADPQTFNANNPGAVFEWRINGTVQPGETDGIFTFNPNAPSPPNYQITVTVTDPFTTCVANDTVNYIVNPRPVFTAIGANPTACGLPNGYINLDITSPGDYSYTIGGTPYSGTLTGPTGVVPIPSPPGLVAGAYGVDISNQTTGCTSTELVALNDTGFDVTIDAVDACGDNIQIDITTANPAQGNYTYRIINAVTSEEATSGNETNDPTAAVPIGTYVAEVRNNAGCVIVSPETDIDEQFPRLQISNLTIDECTATASATATGADTYQWAVAAPINFNSTANPVTPLPNGVYDLILTVSSTVGNTCPADTTISVDISQDPPADLTQGDACQDQVTLSASPTGDYVYRWLRNGVQVVGGQQITVPLADNGASYQVDVRRRDRTCFSSDTETIIVLGLLTVDISNPATCSGQNTPLTATANQTPDSYQWAYNRVAIPSATSNTYTITDGRSGVYRVVVQRSAAGRTCVARDSVSVIVNPSTPGGLTDTGIICPEHTDPRFSEITLDAGAGFIGYNWFRGGRNDPGRTPLGVTDQTYTATEAGVYSVDLLNVYNCPISDETTLVVECDPLIVGPNAFRPGGLNTEFSLFTFFISDQDFEIYIFNRWGEMVYYSTQRDFKWNGGYKNESGRPVPPDTYTYLVKFKSSYRPEKGVQEKRGGVVVLR